MTPAEEMTRLGARAKEAARAIAKAHPDAKSQALLGLAELLQKTERPALIQVGLKAKTLQKTEATQAIVAACEELAA